MQNRSRTEYSILNILTGVGGYIINSVMGFVCRMVFVRCLSADYLGVNGLFGNIITMLSLAELGVSTAIGYALYKPLAENDEEKLASLMVLYSKAYRTIGAIIFVLGVLLMPFLHVIIQEQPNIKESIYLLYLINLFSTASTYFFSYRTSLLVVAQRNYIVGATNYVITIVQSILQIVFLLAFRNYVGYLLIQMAGTLTFNIIVSRIAVKCFPFLRRKDAKPLPKEERKTLFGNIRDLMIYKVSSLMVNSTDNILITVFSGLATTGIASNYTMLVGILNSLLSQVFNGLTASIGNHNASESGEKRYQMFSFLNMMNFWFFGWAALGIFFCSSDLVQLCFGEEYVLPLEIPFVIALNFYTVGMMNAVWTYKFTMGLFHYGRFTQCITGGLNIAFSVLFGMRWGLFGILVATTVARVCTNLWYDPYALFVHGFEKKPVLYLKKYLGYCGVLMIAAVLCQLSFLIVGGSLIVRTLLKIALCSIVTNGVFIIAFHRTAEFQRLKGYGARICAKVLRRG